MIIVLWSSIEYKLGGNSVFSNLVESDIYLIKNGCLYGTVFSIINMFYGMQIDNLDLVIDLKKTGSNLALFGCIVSSSTLIMSGMRVNLTLFTPVGIFSIFSSLVIIILGWIKIKQ